MKVRILRAEANYSTQFARPAISLLGRWLDLHAAICDRLGPFGAKVEDVRYEGSGQAADFVVSWTNFRDELVVRYRIGSLEVWTRNANLVQPREATPPLVVAPVLASIAAARDVDPAIEIVRQSTAADMHGQLESGSVSELLERLVQASEWARPAGVDFDVTCGGVSGKVTLQPSLAFPSTAGTNIYCGLRVVHEGATPPGDALESTVRLADEAAVRVGLETEWP